MKTSLISICALFLCHSYSAFAINLEANRFCGTNQKCIIVDAIEVIDSSNELITESSVKHVTYAWKDLRYKQGCSDVADVVVGGTGSESGQLSSLMEFFLWTQGEAGDIPTINSRPGTFAEHLTNPDPAYNRCSIVVDYTLNTTNLPYAKSVETGRRALSVILGALDKIRTSSGMRGPIRVWGHSKGAAVVESVWLIEAKNSQKTLVANNGTNKYADACPSNTCYYYGIGYPYAQEKGERGDDISHATAKLWTSRDAGWLKNPSDRHNQWQRLRTFSNLSDPVYSCDAATDNNACTSEANHICHDYSGWLDSLSYPTSSYYFDFPVSVYLADQCGNPDEY